MFGSRVLEVVIGLALIFFVMALATSTVVEVISRVLSKRAKELEKVIGSIVDDPARLYETSVFAGLTTGAGKGWLGLGRSRKPSYVSAKSFADAVVEMLVLGRTAATSGGGTAADIYSGMPKQLASRLQSIVEEVGADMTAVKAGLESWFDGIMGRLEGSYKRWASSWLFVIALIVAVGANVSTYRVAESLWVDPATRESVVAAAERIAESDNPEESIPSVDRAVSELSSLALPVGWGADMSEAWDTSSLPDKVATAAGWLATALLVMLGAPFWYDVLSRLVALRSAGAKPAKAVADPESATTALEQETSATRSSADDGATRTTQRHDGRLITALRQDAVAAPAGSTPAGPGPAS